MSSTARYLADKRSPTVAILLCIVVGVIGGHRLYLRQWLHAFLMIAFPIVYTALAWGDGDTAGKLTLLVLLYPIWMVIELIWTPISVRKFNRKLARRLEKA